MVQVPRTVKHKHCFVSDIFPSLTHTYYAAVTVANFTVIQYEKTAAHSKLLAVHDDRELYNQLTQRCHGNKHQFM